MDFGVGDSSHHLLRMGVFSPIRIKPEHAAGQYPSPRGYEREEHVIKNPFAIKNCTMVFDRGMVSSENLQSLEGEKWFYVSTMDRDELAISDFFLTALPEPPTLQDWEQVMAMREFIPFDEDQLLYFREFVDGKHRYILTFDVARFQVEQKMHQKGMDQILSWISQKNKSLVQAKKARRREILEREIQSMLKRKRVKKLTLSVAPTC